MQSIEDIISETTEVVLHECKKYLSMCPENELHEILEYALYSKKACDRALALRLSYQIFGGDWRKVIKAMVAAELMDFAVIIVDDILDFAPRRMSRQSHHAKFSDRITICAANILKSIGSIALLDCLKDINANKKQYQMTMNTYEYDHIGIYTGQYLDISFESANSEDTAIDDFINMIKYTTGVQIGAMCSLGAILASATLRQIKIIKEFGNNLGIIFQMRDDFIDYIDDEKMTGKTAFLDWKDKKKRFPYLIALKVLDESNKNKLKRLFHKTKLSSQDKKTILSFITCEEVINNVKKYLHFRKNTCSNILNRFSEQGYDISLFAELLEIGCRI